MEAAIKHLREGLVREEAGSPTLVVTDALEIVGGRDVFAQVRLRGSSFMPHHCRALACYDVCMQRESTRRSPMSYSTAAGYTCAGAAHACMHAPAAGAAPSCMRSLMHACMRAPARS